MSALGLILVLVILGVIAYFVQTSSKIAPTFKWIIVALLVFIAVVLVLNATGLLDEIRGVKVPHVAIPTQLA